MKKQLIEVTKTLINCLWHYEVFDTPTPEKRKGIKFEIRKGEPYDALFYNPGKCLVQLQDNTIEIVNDLRGEIISLPLEDFNSDDVDNYREIIKDLLEDLGIKEENTKTMRNDIFSVIGREDIKKVSYYENLDWEVIENILPLIYNIPSYIQNSPSNIYNNKGVRSIIRYPYIKEQLPVSVFTIRRADHLYVLSHDYFKFIDPNRIEVCSGKLIKDYVLCCTLVDLLDPRLVEKFEKGWEDEGELPPLKEYLSDFPLSTVAFEELKKSSGGKINTSTRFEVTVYHGENSTAGRKNIYIPYLRIDPIYNAFL